MARVNNLETVILDVVGNVARNLKADPLNLGGVSGAGGGVGARAGGYVGKLPQTRVAYDTDELASSGITGSGTLLDNLNHIRYRLQNLEATSGIVVIDDNDIVTYNDTTTLHFSGGVVLNELSPGNIQVVVSGGAGGPGTITVKEIDGTPTVSGVDTLVFSGATVVDAGGGVAQVLITASGGGGTPLTVEELDGSPSVTNVDTIKFMGGTVTDNGDNSVTVDEIGTGNTYYLTNDLADVSEDSVSMSSLRRKKGPGFTSSLSGIASGENKKTRFATLARQPGLQTISKGTFRFYAYMKQTAGTRAVTAKFKLYKQNTSGTQTLLVTSNSSDVLTGSYVLYELYADTDPIQMDDTDRLVLKLYFDGGATGTDATVSLNVTTTNGDRLELPSGTNGVAPVAYTGDAATILHRILAGRESGYTWEDFDIPSKPTLFTGWAGTPFATPSTLNYGQTYPSVLYIGDTGAMRGFLYTSTLPASGNNLLIYMSFAAGSDGFIGVRLDDGTDNNYLEGGLYNDGTNWTYRLYYRTGGGAVNNIDATATIPSPIPQQILLNITGTRWTNWGGNGWISIPAMSPMLAQKKFAGDVTGLTWTPTRAGITFRDISGTNVGSIDRYGY